MKDVSKIEKGQKLTLSRKTFNGEFENVEVTFLRPITNESRCWVSLKGRDFRVAISKLTPIGERVPAHVQYGQAPPPEEGDASKNEVKASKKETVKKNTVAKEEVIIPAALKNSEKVETTVKKKEADQPKTEAPKKVVDTTEEAKISKLDRIVRLFANNPDLKRKEAHEALGIDITYCGDTINILKQYVGGATEKALAEKYSKWLSAKRLTNIINSYQSCQK